MLATPKRLQTSSSIPFIPRQVIMLETESAAAAVAAQPVEGKKRRKEKSIDEKKKKKRSAETLENGSAAPSRSLELVRCGSSAVEGKRREALIGSIAAFLESNGFSKSLAVFRSEAQIETDVSKTSIMNLEDLFYKFLESSKTIIDWLKEEEKEKRDIPENVKGLNTLDGSEHSQKKKRKHRSEKDDGMKDELHKTELSSEGCSVENSEKKSKEFEASCDGTDIKSSVSAESLHVDSKGKKKKKKSSAGSITEEKSHQEDNHGIENSDQQLLVKEEKLKKKSKKHNPSVGSETDAIEQKVEEQKSLTNGSTPSVESNPNHKDEKKKKRKKSSDSLAEDTSKLEGDDVDKKTGTLEIPDKPESETLAVSKKKKTKRSSEDSALPATGSVSEQLTNGECNSQKEETPGFSLGNGSIDKKGREINTSSAKKEKHSAEPKTAFQRVKAEEVEFADERLQDNSYWAKDGADIGYGAKAQEILGQVRGRDFRHEKTKKKRGSYRGGQIDLQSHSIKFNYSDEE